MTDKDTIAVYDNQVDGYADMIEAKPEDSKLASFLQTVTPRGYILDLGCGPAHASQVMREEGFSVDPVDASPEMIRYANETYDIGARLASFTDIDSQAVYDGIWASFSLLHATKTEFPGILHSMRIASKPEGVIGLSMKTGSGAKRDRLGRFYSYYTEAELRDALEQTGFSVFDVSRGEAKGLAGGLDPWSCLLARAKH